MLAQCLATTVTGRDTTNTSWQTNADESDGMGFVPLPWDTPIDPSRLTRRGGSRTRDQARDLLLLSRTLYQLSYQSKVYFQRASRPKAINILRKTYAKLVDSKQGRPGQGALPPPPVPVCACSACVPHLARHHDTQTLPTIAIVRWQACTSGWLPAREHVCPAAWQPAALTNPTVVVVSLRSA